MDGDTLYIEGVIGKRHARQFQQYLGEGIRRVVINSSGGDVSSSLDIAEAIHANDLVVEARGLCLSSCAAYVWMAGAERYIAPKTILAFHHGSSPFLQIYRQANNLDHRVVPSDELLDNAKRERNLYEQLDVDISVLYLGNDLREMRCLRFSEATGGEIRIMPEYKFAGYVPTLPLLESYRVSVVSGDLPKNETLLRLTAAQLGIGPELPPLAFAGPEDEDLRPSEILARVPQESYEICR